jgi:endonuclease YncB( thermonuclease family)
LSALIADSHDLDVRTTGERDEFDRPLALISVDQLDLGETLVAAGLAARRTPKPFRWCEGFSIAQPGAPKVNSPYDLEK